MSATSYAGALRLALDHALRDDDDVFIYGQDVAGSFGGAFKITKGLSDRYGDRVINAPISEDAIAGMAIGAAMEGMRPVIEFQFADFATIAFNQLVNHAGTTYWRTGKPCPLTARLPVGGTPGGGPFHSQMAEAWLGHHPGMVVFAPATVDDAYCMLRQAIASNDPVIFCEHKYLYEQVRDDSFNPDLASALPAGEAAIRRHGRDCTVVAWSAMLYDALRAADVLAREHGIEIEVIDLRCLRPLPRDGVLGSVSRTGRLVVASEDFPFGGVAAELLALVAQHGFGLLDAPPVRVSSLDTPIPFHPSLWAAHRPQAADIVAAVIQTVRF
ncbi:MAG: alpha-ketoacid dehydrogenase subunit beta [Planctomycetota bacterium]|jgi:pyruvate/2-oxoglutarate/acetoin dehydrogenase E1 component|nr:alpha-ketoacid dehydrogenase subunit beta [Planctomycetota bacterium]